MVFDLETTGLSAQTSRICEVGAVRVQALELVDCFQSLVDPGVSLPEPVARLTGLRELELRRAPHVGAVVGRFLAFAGEAPLVAHNARFDQRFLERQLRRRESRRLAEPPLCTAALARRLLEGRLRGVSLASLAHFFGVATTPCHRALPDAEATAQVLVRLIGLAQELGARRLSELRTLAAPRARRVHGKRALIRGAPTRPGVYLFRDRHEHVLYVGRARDLRARLRSYFQSDRQRPSVEAALLALERIEWQRPRLRARGRAGGAPADPGAAATRELAQPATRPRALPETPRRRVRRHQDRDRARPDRQPPTGRARRPRARQRHTGRARAAARRRAAAPPAATPHRPGRKPPLRRSGPAPRPHRCAREPPRAAPPARTTAHPRHLPDRTRTSLPAGGKHSSSTAARYAPSAPSRRGRAPDWRSTRASRSPASPRHNAGP